MSDLKSKWVGRWKGQTVVCIASGPSLTASDVALVRQTGYPVIVTNNTWQMAPWANVLLGFDAKWWLQYTADLGSFAGERVTCTTKVPGADCLAHQVWFQPFGNSGAAAISLAVTGEAAAVWMLGFDCKPAADGRRHWHADHPEPLSNARSMSAWQAKFSRTANYAKKSKCKVTNATRDTALTCFERKSLEELLHIG